MWYIDSDNVIRVEGLKDAITGVYINSATVTGILYELPTLHPNAAVAVDKGDGKVGIPCTGHGQVVDDSIRLERTLNYNAAYMVLADTTVNELVITASFVAETFTGEEFIYSAIVGTKDVPITFDAEGSGGNYVGKIPYTTVLLQGREYVMCIKEVSETEQVLAKIIHTAGFQGL